MAWRQEAGPLSPLPDHRATGLVQLLAPELEIPDSSQRSVMGIFTRRGDGVPEGLWVDFWGCVYVCV